MGWDDVVAAVVSVMTLFLLIAMLMKYPIHIQTQPQPQVPAMPNPAEVSDEAAGIMYNGPPTYALAGYYCVYAANVLNNGWLVNGTYQPNATAYHPPGYTVQLNAGLSNGLWLQDVYGGAYESQEVITNNGEYTSTKIEVEEQVWNGQDALSTIAGPPADDCGWLVIAIGNGTAYFGYSGDGVNINWYASYPVGNATIESSYMTNIVIAGPGNYAGVNFTKLYAVLALYYWNGTTWAPAPVAIEGGGTGEFVVNAWVYMSNNEAVVSWPMQVNASIAIPSVKPPSITP